MLDQRKYEISVQYSRRRKWNASPRARSRKSMSSGSRLAVTTTNKDNFVLGMQVCRATPLTGHTLADAIEQVKRVAGVVPENSVYVLIVDTGAWGGRNICVYLRPTPWGDANYQERAPSTKCCGANHRSHEGRWQVGTQLAERQYSEQDQRPDVRCRTQYPNNPQKVEGITFVFCPCRLARENSATGCLASRGVESAVCA